MTDRKQHSNTMSTLCSDSCHSSYDNIDSVSDENDYGRRQTRPMTMKLKTHKDGLTNMNHPFNDTLTQKCNRVTSTINQIMQLDHTNKLYRVV